MTHPLHPAPDISDVAERDAARDIAECLRMKLVELCKENDEWAPKEAAKRLRTTPMKVIRCVKENTNTFESMRGSMKDNIVSFWLHRHLRAFLGYSKWVNAVPVARHQSGGKVAGRA